MTSRMQRSRGGCLPKKDIFFFGILNVSEEMLTKRFSVGCLVDSTFYPEGHKLPANQTNPCEICFCIGGSKRCAPKKCAPIIKNCRPIIPEGQCCPSSYDCSNYRFYFLADTYKSRNTYVLNIHRHNFHGLQERSGIFVTAIF